MLVRISLRRKMRPEQWRSMRRQRQLRRNAQRHRRRKRYVVEIVGGNGGEEADADAAYRAALSPRAPRSIGAYLGQGAVSRTPPSGTSPQSNAWSPTGAPISGPDGEGASPPSPLSHARRLTSNGSPPAGAAHNTPHRPEGPRVMQAPHLVWSPAVGGESGQWASAARQSARDAAEAVFEGAGTRGSDESGSWDHEPYRPTITPREIAAARRARALARLPRVQVREQRVSASDGYQDDAYRRRSTQADRLAAVYAAPLPDVVDSVARRKRGVHITTKNRQQHNLHRSLEASPFAVGVRPPHKTGAHSTRAKRIYSSGQQRGGSHNAWDRAQSDPDGNSVGGKDLRAQKVSAILDMMKGNGAAMGHVNTAQQDRARQHRQGPENGSISEKGMVAVSPLREADATRRRALGRQRPSAAGRGRDGAALRSGNAGSYDTDGSMVQRRNGLELPPISPPPHTDGCPGARSGAAGRGPSHMDAVRHPDA